MADVNAQSVEDYADRIIYRYPGGRYEQVLGTIAQALTTGLKTLVNTSTARVYVMPATGMPARFFKVEWLISVALQTLGTANDMIGSVLMPCSFLRLSATSLNYDGKELQTEFYEKKSENFVTSPQLRAVNIGNVSVEPVFDFSSWQFTGLSNAQWSGASPNCGLVAILQPTITFYKK